MVEHNLGRHKEIDSEGRRIVIFVGPEGSGKSEHSKRLSKDLGIPFFGTGDMIRARKEEKSPIGDAIRDMLFNNAYLPPKLIGEMVAERLSREDVSKGAIIDGALRTLEETQKFDETLELAGKSGFEIDVIFLDIPPKLGLERRLKSENKRPDDTREGISKRLKHFYVNLEERMKIVKERYRFFQIDATSSLDEVYSAVLSALNIKV